MNPIVSGSLVTLHYRLCGPQGEVFIDTFGAGPATLTIGGSELSPALQARLLGLREGAHATFELAAGEAFGPRNPALLQKVAASLLAQLSEEEAAYGVGDVVEFPVPGGQGRYAGIVREVGDGWLLFDFNHPLAGEAVSLEVQVIGVLTC